MEIVRETFHTSTAMWASDIRSSNDNRRKALSVGRSVFPEDAVARISSRRAPVQAAQSRSEGQVGAPQMLAAVVL
ncbi:hypothetical protein QFZ34_001301 [Phyllobacterium ifriqiyense]|uniref:Uncharacterized protein n=1 Tax=Phyllobacterium ifriqiyense TaxID=314238 RepID=A0ABU0S5T4_9HYPH|nr:hypothetical protein [Phyllobacterium ifriqiyense]